MIFTPWQKYTTGKAQRKNAELRLSGAYTDAESIGIIFHNDDQSKIEEAEKLSTLLKMDGKKVKTIAYEHKNTIKHLPYDTFTKESFNFWGKLTTKPVQDFIDAEFNFLICLDKQPNHLIKSILANSNAKCRVGRYNEEDQESFEMLFISEGDELDWIDKLYQYLKKLS